MATYMRPGVFVDETLTPIATNSQSPGEAVAAFVAPYSFGPSEPTRIRSWTEFLKYYGGLGSGSEKLGYAVFTYFANGGTSAYVVRAVPADSTAATVTLLDRAGVPEGGPANILRLTAKAAGSFGNKIYIDISDPGTGTGRFNLVVKVGSLLESAIVDRYTDVSMDPTDARYLLALLNSPTSGSKFVEAESLLVGAWDDYRTPAVQTGTPLTTGSDGVATPNLVEATKSLEATGEILNINLPAVTDSAILNPIIDWCADYGYAFLVVDAPATANLDNTQAIESYRNLLPLGNGSTTPLPLRTSSYVAVYGPWLSTSDPGSAASGATRLLPPGGAVLGQFAAADEARGPHQTPAGIAYRVRGVFGVERTFSNQELDLLNQVGLNVIRPVPQAGFCIMGGRTLQVGMPDRYVSVRRLLTYVRKILVDSTRFAVFAPNTPDLWHSLSAVVTQQLTGMTQAGMLKGNTPDDAYQVICDETNNTEQTVSNGEVHIDVGLAVARPAEFVGIHIAQYEGGSSTSENA